MLAIIAVRSVLITVHTSSTNKPFCPGNNGTGIEWFQTNVSVSSNLSSGQHLAEWQNLQFDGSICLWPSSKMNDLDTRGRPEDSCNNHGVPVPKYPGCRGDPTVSRFVAHWVWDFWSDGDLSHPINLSSQDFWFTFLWQKGKSYHSHVWKEMTVGKYHSACNEQCTNSNN